MTADIFDIERSSYVDGPGVRTTIFMKGCNLNCAWCHNPESKSRKTQRLWYSEKCTHCGKCASKCQSLALSYDPAGGSLKFDADQCKYCGRCELICPNNAIAICGYQTDIEQLMEIIVKDCDIYAATGGGVTISGGECMLDTEFITELLKECKHAKIHTAIDTAGNIPFESFERVLPYTDLFLYDIKVITPELHKKYTGVDNNLILENYKRLISRGANIIVRVPMIAEVNANETEFSKIADFLAQYPPQSVELLSYHAMGENKYRAIYQLEPERFTPPSDIDMEKYKNFI
ncbi:MAG: glycyl-radical enzyme activating protein [Clostridiales bacterium]|nr:glycyl-radical enzyme activating protein [Clostridiales bacterium]